MQAILIEPAQQRVRAVEHAGDLASVLALLDVRLVDAVRLERGGAIYVDDEGRLAEPPLIGFQVFLIDDDDDSAGEWSPFYAGPGLVVGTTPTGRDAAAPFTVDELAPRIRFGLWLPREPAG